MITTLDWTFPLPRTHTGLPLGNGRTGLIIWGGDRTLHVTVGRADLWDHRGGMPWTSRQNFTDIRAALETNDEERIRDLFRPESAGRSGQPPKPSVLPLGRIEVELAPGCRLVTAHLDLPDGVVRVRYTRAGGAQREMTVGLHPERDLAWVLNADDVSAVSATTSWDLMAERLSSLSFRQPEPLGEAGDGWFWRLPADPGVYVAWRNVDDQAGSGSIAITVGRAARLEDAAAAVDAALTSPELATARDESLTWWRRYWERAARITVPNPVLQEIHDYGLYLFAGLTNPGGVAATLQGPWIEEYDFPPWSSDYHFNINVQMCYSPAYRSGLLDHLRPLFELVWSWRTQLRENARNFIGVDGYMLPHAVDDRCTCMGTFWTGTIDHACTAWVAQMMFDYADYSGDTAFLTDTALPFMKGVFAVYRAMMEDDGDALRLPVSVSPEYRGASMDAWGANASFQLAAVHRLCDNLQAAARIAGEEPDPAWAEVSRRLPVATLTGNADRSRIALWEGMDLEESHRHHSHLAGIVPFDALDPLADEWRIIVANSVRHWIGAGMGLWSGWCMSWASQLHSRVHNGAGAELLLELWRRVFTNEGRGSMHDAVMNGVTLMGAPPIVVEAAGANASDSGHGSTGAAILARAERMQMDGAMGGVAAVQEMLLYTQRGVINVFPAVPPSWPAASFERMRAPGGLVISGWYEGPDRWSVEVRAGRTVAATFALPGEAARRQVELSGGERVILNPGG